jgi:hypothetical protein
MTTKPGDIAASAALYERQLTILAPRERVFDAIATLDGPRHWWTTMVTGSAADGGELCFGFAGLDEQIIMHVDGPARPQRSNGRARPIPGIRSGPARKYGSRLPNADPRRVSWASSTPASTPGW